MNLRSAIAAALTRATPTSVTCRLETRPNTVGRTVNSVVVQTWKRRPSETTQDAFNRVMTEEINAGRIGSILASSSDEGELGEEELNDVPT